MDDLLTNDDAVNIIQNEGIGYAVQFYCNGISFKDLKTHELWDRASQALEDLEHYLEKDTGREIE